MHSIMARISQLTSSLLWISIAQQALAQGVIIGNTDISDETWASVLSQPNATGSAPFSAPNVSIHYPADGINHDGWIMSIDVKADVPISADRPNDLTTAASISITPPDWLLVANGSFQSMDVDPSWSSCLAFFGPVASGGGFSNGSSLNGSCDVLGSQCVEDLTGALAGASGFDCTLAAIPSSCSAFDGSFYGESTWFTYTPSSFFVTLSMVCVGHRG